LNIPPNLIEAVIRQESGGNPNAVSPRGAVGLMQIMPDTARAPGFGLSPLPADKLRDPEANRAFGTQYLSAMMNRYQGDVPRALVAYNWGPGNADKWDGRMETLPDETRKYVRNVTSMAGEGGGVAEAGSSPYMKRLLAAEAPAPESDGAKPVSPYMRRLLNDAAPKPKQAEARANPDMVDGMGRAFADGALFGMGDNVAAAIGAALGANPESGEFFDYDDSGGYGMEGMSQRYRANLEMEREKRGEFRESNPYATAGAELAGAVVGGVTGAAVAPIRAAGTTTGRVAQAATGGAIQGGVTAAAMADEPGDSRVLQGAQGGALGLVLGPVSVPLAALTRRIGAKASAALRGIFKRAPQSFDPATGQLTEEARRQLTAIGVNADEVSGQLARAYMEAAQDATRGGAGGAAERAGEVAARTAPARSFGIDTTRGQATGDIPQIASEEAMRAGARGNAAFREMDEFGRRQRGQVSTARDSLAREVAPGGGQTDAVDAAEMAIAGVRREAETARTAGREAYKAFEDMGGGIKGGAVKNLDERLAVALDAEGIIIDELTPNASAALGVMRRQFAGAENGAVPFANLERTRQMLRRFASAAESGSLGQDQMAMKALIGEYDEWLEGAMDYAISDGSSAALEAVRKARGLWSDYLRTYTGKKGADNMIRKVVEDEMAPDQVIGWLLGASKNIGGGQSSLIAKRFRDILGPDSPEFQAMKKATIDRLTMNNGEIRTPAEIASALGGFLDGKGKTLAESMFTPAELRRVREFREAMRVLQVPAKAGNPSGSGYEVARAATSAARALFTALGFASGGPGGAVIGAAGTSAAADFVNRLAAKAATQGIRGPAPSLGGAVGLGGGGAAALAGESPIR